MFTYGKGFFYKINNILIEQLYIENLIRTVLPIYNRNTTGVADITGGVQLFDSPRSMIPAGSSPPWVSSNQLSEVFIPGISQNSFRFFRYI